MRIINRTMLMLGLALAGGAAPLSACPDETCFEFGQTTLKFPGKCHYGVLRGDHLLCLNDASRLIVVDLKHGKTLDLGSAEGKHWRDGDIADGQMLMRMGNKLHVHALKDGKRLHEFMLEGGPVHATGFAGKGRFFEHRGKNLTIREAATGKTLHTIDLGKQEDHLFASGAWQIVGKRLYVVGPATTLCAIDLDTGELLDRFSIDASAGIVSLRIEGSLVYCIGGNGFSWAPVNNLTCFDMESKKSLIIGLSRQVQRFGRLAGGPYGTAYLVNGNRLDRYTMHGESCGQFTTGAGETILAVWRNRAVVSVKDEIRLVEIKETPVARK